MLQVILLKIDTIFYKKDITYVSKIKVYPLVLSITHFVQVLQYMTNVLTSCLDSCLQLSINLYKLLHQFLIFNFMGAEL